MKKLLLFCTLMLSTYLVSAQFNVYHPFPDSNAYWGEESAFYPGTGSSLDIYDYGYKMVGDTIVAGKTYSKVYEVGGASSSGAVTPFSTYNCAIRSDSMKHVFVCCQVSGYKQDTLLYDFNMKVGDTVKGVLIKPINGLLYVDSIDSVNFSGNYRKRFFIATTQNNPNKIVDEIVEGMGSTQGLLEQIIVPFEGSNKIICFQQNGIVLYGTNGYFTHDTCIVWGPLGVNTISEPVTCINVYPNPANTAVTLSFKLLQQKNAAINLYNTMGQLISSRVTVDNDEAITEDVSALPNGVYYYTLVVNGSVMATNKLVIVK